MTIATELTKLQTNLTNSYTAVQAKGGTLPQNQCFDNLPNAIATCGGILENLLTEIIAGNNPVDVTALQSAETQINAFLGSSS